MNQKNSNMKTIREWLEELPEPYRTQAIYNVIHDDDPVDLDSEFFTDNVAEVICSTFVWSGTEQGIDYWSDIAFRLSKNNEL